MRSLRLTRRGTAFAVVALVLLVAAPVLSLPALLSAFALLVGLVGTALVQVRVGQSNLAVERTFAPEVVPHGGLVRATLHVENRSGWPSAPARWHDTVPVGIAADASGDLPGLGGSRSGRARASMTYDVRGVRRGRHRLGPLRVETTDPFGLVRRSRRVGEPQDVLVLPKVEPVARATGRAADDEGAARAAPHLAGVGDDDVVARPYLPGDALKRMHWKATAHRGEPMVRQEERWADPRTGLVIDTDALSFGTAHEGGEWSYSPELEWAISAFASVATHLVAAGHAVTTRSPGRAVDRDRVEGDDALEDVLVDLADLQPASRPAVTPDDVDPGERTVVVVLGHLDADRAAQWADALAGATSVLALVHSGARQSTVDLLRTAGWHVVAYAAQDDVADAWESLQARGRGVGAGAPA